MKKVNGKQRTAAQKLQPVSKSKMVTSNISTKSKSNTASTMSRNGKELHATRIDLPAKTRAQLVEMLNHTLAQTLDLKTQVKQAHWNVKGLQFYPLHLLFDEIATELEEYTDMVAERITSLAGVALGTVRMAAKRTDLPDFPADLTDGMDHVATLADRFAQYGRDLRDNIDESDDLGDKDTADLYTELSREIDKRLWFLEAHLQG